MTTNLLQWRSHWNEFSVCVLTHFMFAGAHYAAFSQNRIFRNEKESTCLCWHTVDWAHHWGRRLGELNFSLSVLRHSTFSALLLLLYLNWKIIAVLTPELSDLRIISLTFVFRLVFYSSSFLALSLFVLFFLIFGSSFFVSFTVLSPASLLCLYSLYFFWPVPMSALTDLLSSGLFHCEISKCLRALIDVEPDTAC